MKNILSQYNKRLDDQQMTALLQKEGSSNPLWLTLACEELRVFGKFEMLLEKIHSLPDDLIKYVYNFSFINININYMYMYSLSDLFLLNSF